MYYDDKYIFDDVAYNFLPSEILVAFVGSFENNERLDDEELQAIAFQSNLITFNLQSINQFINDTKQLYESFGYNDVQIP